MTTPILLTGWEHGVTPTASTGGGLGDGVTSAPTVTSAQANSGTYSLRCYAASAATPRVQYTLATPATLVGRIYFRFAAWPSLDNEILYANVTAGATFAIKIRAATHKLYARFFAVSDGTEHATACELDRWYRLDFKFDASTGTSTIDFKLDGVDGAQLTHSQTATTFTALPLGPSNSDTLDMYLDDLVVTATSGDYPIGAGGTEGLSPTSDGTHNAGTNVMEDNAGTDIGAVTAFDLVGKVPINTATSYIRQAANGTANYAAVNFADISATHGAIIGAEALLAYTAATTSGNTGGCIVSKDGFSTSTTLWGAPGALADYSDGGTAAPFYKRAIVAGVTDDTTVNALAARLGYSGDANPDPYWINLIIEAAYTVTSNALIGSAAGVAAQTGTLTGAGAMTGAGAGLAAQTGTLTGTVAITGTAAGVTSAAGTLSSTNAIAGTSAGVAIAAGTLIGAGVLAGAAAGSATQAGTLAGAGVLTGTAAGIATAEGTLVSLGSNELIGAAAGVAAVAGMLSGAGALMGAASGVAAQTGTLSAGSELVGTAAGLASLSGTLTGAGVLSGASAGTSPVAGTLTGAIALTGTGTGLATVTGTLTIVSPEALAGAAVGAADVTGTLTGTGALIGAGAGLASATATGTLYAPLIGTGAGLVSATATLTASGILAGQAVADATADATLTADGALIGLVAGVGTAIGSIVNGAFYLAGTRTIYLAARRGELEPALRGEIEADRRVSIMAED